MENMIQVTLSVYVYLTAKGLLHAEYLPNLHFLQIRNFHYCNYLANFWGGFDFSTSHLEPSSIWKNFQEHAVREPLSEVASAKVQDWIVMFQK